MTSMDGGGPASRCESSVSLGLVGVPSFSQAGDAFEFDANPDIDYNAAFDHNIFADIDDFCTTPGLLNGQTLKDIEVVPILPLQTDMGGTDLPQNPALNEQYDSFTYDPTNLSLFSVQQNFGYPDPQGCYTAHKTPYFPDGYDLLAPPVDAFGTLGLAAIPGNNAMTGYDDVQYPTQQYDYLPNSWTVPVEGGSLPALIEDYMPFDPSMQYATYSPKNARVAAAAAQTYTAAPVPYSTTEQHQHDDFQVPRSDSDEDYHDQPKPTKISKREKRQQRRQSSLSSACSSAGTPAELAKYNAGEKPKKNDAKPWVRVNANTEGDTRTAKINNWKNKYDYKPLPMGTWTSGKHTFKYTQYENVDFLTEAPMSTRKIREYIMNYPCDGQKRLILWVQKMPADTCRRYGSQQHAKCAFKECPVQKYVTGTISTGEYRVAFDEKYFTYGDKVDPYDCTAYAHLYCIEQFLDFELVCQAADVRVDTRHVLPLEPNRRAAFSMVDVPARDEIERFVKLATRGKLRMAERWFNYPFHGNYGPEDQKPHEYTLTYLAHCMYKEHQDDSHKKQAALRRVTVSQRRVHLGDLEMSVADKRIEKEVFKGKKGRNLKHEDYYSQRIWNNINRAKKEAKEFLEAKARGKKRSARGQPKTSKKSKGVQYEESEDDEATYSAGARRSRQKKHKVNYAESPIEQLHEYDEEAYMQAQAAPKVQAADVQHLSTYLGQEFGDVSQPPIDPMLDTPYGLYAVPATPKLNIEDFENFPTSEDDLPEDNLEKLLSLERRQSCADFRAMGILKSPGLVPGRTPRRAVFGAQPVTDSKEYGINDPPIAMFVRRGGRIRARSGR
ncbi:hypothetical protein E8E12_009210 [Didymella heteroderae]|uniref:Uncharacterized protein n=1 Tax=Didymella heteroderae TaxID=1769908 RepID=A0A9P4WR40_9PLEO|nr:hypothetical protein E8E12_009210 [Didymella heteroderae]